ncbi:MAG: DotU family type IV/VI secretion system protein [Myxococcota bacterium]
MDRVNEVTRDALSIVGHIRFAEESALGEPAVLQRKLRTLITDAMQRASSLGFSQHDVQDIGYVLTALIDEVALGKGGAIREYWLTHMLQLELFHSNVAGQEVFDRLQVLLSDPTRVEVLEVYYLALLFDFRGKFRVRGGEAELLELTERARDAIRRSGRHAEVALSPNGVAQSSGTGGLRQNKTLRLAAFGALGVSVLLYIGMTISLSSKVGDLEESFEVLREEIE